MRPQGRARARLLVLALLLPLLGSLAARPALVHADPPDPTSPYYLELEEDLLLSCEDGDPNMPIPISLQVRQYFGTRTDHLERLGSAKCNFMDSGRGLQKVLGSFSAVPGSELDNGSPTQPLTQKVTDGVTQGTIVGFQLWTTFNFGMPFINEIGPVYHKQFIDTKTFAVGTTESAGPCQRIQMYMAAPMYQGYGTWVMHYDSAFDLGSYDGAGKKHYEWHITDFMIKGPDPDVTGAIVSTGGPGGPNPDGSLPPTGQVPGCTPAGSAASTAARVPNLSGKGTLWPLTGGPSRPPI